MELLSPKVAADFSDNHGNRVSAELHAQGEIKIINGFHKTNTANLKKIICVLAAASEAFDDT